MLRNIILFCLVLLYSECNSAKKGQLPAKQDKIEHPGVIIDNSFMPGYDKPTYNINSVTIAGDILSLNISYTGGCNEHSFELISNGLYAKSLPPQITVYLKHQSHDDTCEKIIEKTITYDISKLQYPGQHTLLIKIITFKEKTAYNY